MKLTGKTKESFEKWYVEMILVERLDYNKFTDRQILAKFYRKIPSEKFGVLVDYFFTHNIIISQDYEENTKQFFGYVKCITSKIKVDVSDNLKTPLQFWTSAIDKANSIREEQLKEKPI